MVPAQTLVLENLKEGLSWRGCVLGVPPAWILQQSRPSGHVENATLSSQDVQVACLMFQKVPYDPVETGDLS